MTDNRLTHTAAQVVASEDMRVAEVTAELQAKLAEVTRERDEHWANFCERSGDFKRWQAEQKRADDLATRCAESQAREAELRAALTKVDDIACRSVGGNHPEDLPGPANRDGEELAMLARAALAHHTDDTALREAVAGGVAEFRSSIVERMAKADAYDSIAAMLGVKSDVITALREFGLRVGREVVQWNPSTATDRDVVEFVDAVLRGEK